MTKLCIHGPKVYLAAPLFSVAEKRFNEQLCTQLELCGVDVYLPQRDGGLIVDLISKGVAPRAAARSIFQRDLEALMECDACLIVLDGRSVDEGAAFELGVAYSARKLCIGLQTDPRRLLATGNNPMLEGALACVFESIEQAVAYLSMKSAAGVSG